MRFGILGMGTALPANTVTMEEALGVAQEYFCEDDDQRRKLKALHRMSGVKTRQVVVVDDGPERTTFFRPPGEGMPDGPSIADRMRKYETEALPLALDAARNGLAQSGVDAASITHLVTVSCSGFTAPGVDIGLIKQLGLAPTVQRTHVGFMGCHGALNGLRVARGFVESDPNARVLISAVELCSLHYHYGWNPEQLVANAIFADGSAAIVGGAVDESVADTWQIKGTGSCLIPESEDAMTWRIRNNGFEMSLSNAVPKLICEHLRPWMETWLGEYGFALEDVQSWAVHPGGPRILSSVCQALDLERDAVAISREVLRNHGNMSSPTVLFILDKLRAQNALRPCVALGFGPGLMAEATLIV